MSETSSPPRRRWRFLYQFSLRTLLLATAAVAIFCNWYFQPKYHEEELAGKELRLRRQVRLEKPVVSAADAADPFGPPTESLEINHGHWTLLDGDDFVLSRGHFADDQAAGKWVTYYPTGHKAAEGKMLRGVKVGPWRTWYEDGTPASEVTYTDKPLERTDARPRNPFFDSQDPFAPAGKGGSSRPDCRPSRAGPAKAWYENGQLKYEGAFHANMQHGTWTCHDRHGRVTATGPFRAGKRHGRWTVTRRVSEGPVGQASSLPAHSRSEWTTLTVEYIDGRTADELARLLTHLEAKLADPLRYRRQQALIDLAEIGEGAVPLLQRRLTSSDKPEQAAILGVLPRMKDAAGPLLATARELARGSDPLLSHHARLTLFQLDPSACENLYASLLAEAIAARAPHQALAELVTLYRADKSRQSAIFRELILLPQKRKDVSSEQVFSAVCRLEGNLTSHLVAACQSPSEQVRVVGVQTLHSIQRGLLYGSQAYVQFDEPVWSALVKRLKADSSQEVRALATEIERWPQSPFGPGMGGGFF